MENKNQTSQQQKQKILFHPNNKQTVLKLFQKSNPLSVNNKSVYRQDYESLLDQNWLRTEAISSLITILEQKYQTEITKIVEDQFKFESTEKEKQDRQNLIERFKSYIKIIDPFVVTMILLTQEDFILQTLEGLEMFSQNTKYVLFPMNTDHGKGNHWFLTVLKNPRYQDQNPQIFVLNSIPTSKNDTSLYMANDFSQQIIRLLGLFHKNSIKLNKIPISRIERITHQSNSYDCGIFTVAYIEQLLFKILIEKEIQRIVKLRIWQKKTEQKDQLERGINSKSEFLLLKSSTFLRKNYRQTLEHQIVSQNQYLLK